MDGGDEIVENNHIEDKKRQSKKHIHKAAVWGMGYCGMRKAMIQSYEMDGWKQTTLKSPLKATLLIHDRS